MSLQVDGGSVAGGAMIHAYAHNVAPHETFELIASNNPKHPKAFYLRTHNSMAVDVSGSTTENRPEIVQWEFHGNDNQLWYIEKAN